MQEKKKNMGEQTGTTKKSRFGVHQASWWKDEAEEIHFNSGRFFAEDA